MSHRRGVSLIELLVVLSVLTVVLSSITVVYTTMTRLERQIHDEFTTADVLDRLAARFREDAHQSSTVTTGADGKTIVLRTVAGTEITYLPGERSVQRVVREAGRARQRESFASPAECEVSWRVEPPSRLITMTMRCRVAHRSTGLDVWREATIVAATRDK